MKFKHLLLLVGLTEIVTAQNSLDTYVEAGLKNNLVIQQKNISLEKALYALKIANSQFFPTIGIKGDYQSGEGGRQIAIPLGDMLNPVYSTLNQVTASNSFPQINNVETNFLPRNFYDLRVRTSMPLVNSDLIYNKKIQQQQVVLQDYDLEIYKKELVKTIKVAYYTYLGALQSVAIYDNALALAQEGKRINESLVANGKTVKAYVLRSESEIQNLEARKSSAIQQVNNSRIYFNFLLNAETSQRPDTSGVPAIDLKKIDQYLLNENSVESRIELKALAQSASVYQTALKMNKAYWLPKVSTFLDLGSQASDWKFNSTSRYYFFGVQLDIPLFAAGKNTYKIRQSELDLKNQSLQTIHTHQQLQLSADMAKNNLLSVYENYKANQNQWIAASAYNQLIEKGYREGINTFIETIDARNQLVNASLQMIITKYQLMSAMVTYEREITQ